MSWEQRIALVALGLTVIVPWILTEVTEALRPAKAKR